MKSPAAHGRLVSAKSPARTPWALFRPVRGGAMSRRRANGQGTVYLRKDGRWEGAGYVLSADGGSRRVRVYGTTRAQAQSRLDEALGQSVNGVPVGGATV